VTVYAYYEGPVPDAVIDWFKAALPDAQIRLAGLE
jgi:hypothetical protein